MSDRKTVIDNLVNISWFLEEEDMPILAGHVRDAITMLREQQPVEPDIGQVVDGVYAVCANCRYSLKLLFDAGGPKVGYLPKFCPECGREVKWSE